MYVPKLFENKDTESILEFIQKHPFGILITQGVENIVATHIPLLLYKLESGNYVLRGHIARANDQHLNWQKSGETEVLTIFTGAHAYISSSWYEKPNVSTWNYIAVHAYGKLKILEGDALHAAMSDLTRHFEAGQAKPMLVENMPTDMVRRELRGIVGFEIAIEKLQGKEKLSQNRNSADYQKIIHKLDQSSYPEAKAVADAMRKKS
jgi:transcriptional regulator